MIVLAANNNIDGQQTAQRLQINAVIPNRQIAAFHQRVSEIARHEGVFKIRLVVGAWRKQHNPRILALRRNQLLQCIAVGLKKTGQAPHVRGAKNIRQNARRHQTIFQRVAGARRSLRSIRQNPPLPIGRAGQVRRVHVQKHAAWRFDSPAGTQKSGVWENQIGRQHGFP